MQKKIFTVALAFAFISLPIISDDTKNPPDILQGHKSTLHKKSDAQETESRDSLFARAAKLLAIDKNVMHAQSTYCGLNVAKHLGFHLVGDVKEWAYPLGDRIVKYRLSQFIPWEKQKRVAFHRELNSMIAQEFPQLDSDKRKIIRYVVFQKSPAGSEERETRRKIRIAQQTDRLLNNQDTIAPEDFKKKLAELKSIKKIIRNTRVALKKEDEPDRKNLAGQLTRYEKRRKKIVKDIKKKHQTYLKSYTDLMIYAIGESLVINSTYGLAKKTNPDLAHIFQDTLHVTSASAFRHWYTGRRAPFLSPQEFCSNVATDATYAGGKKMIEHCTKKKVRCPAFLIPAKLREYGVTHEDLEPLVKLVVKFALKNCVMDRLFGVEYDPIPLF